MNMDHINSLLLLLFLCLCCCSSSHCKEEKNYYTYIVHVAKEMKPSFFTTHKDWYAEALSSVKDDDSSAAPADHRGGIIYEYEHVFHGFAASMTDSEAVSLTRLPGFQSALQVNGDVQLHTTRTPDFLGLHHEQGWSMWQASRYGSDLIVGILDTGVWPERSSYDDTGMDPVPAKWKGVCESGTAFNSTLCNRKIIGARVFYKGYESVHGRINESDSQDFRSPRDAEGHGTHTSSTLAGVFVANATLFGYASGIAAGIAPNARLAIYKVCWVSGCHESDILAAFDAALHDGVDVISLSMGDKPVNHYLDPIAIGSFAAMERGILTSASAGNSGPYPSSVLNVAPWILTVAASTLDRTFPASVTLGDGTAYAGVSLFAGNDTPYAQQFSLVYAGDAALNLDNRTQACLCQENSLNSTLVTGKIVVCDRGISIRTAKSVAVQKAGGVATIIANEKENGEELTADSSVAPVVLVGFKAAQAIKAYLAQNANPTAVLSFKGTVVGVKPSPVMAAFSSRGPNLLVPEILKPDITAPGINVLAAWTGNRGPSSQPGDNRITEFNIMSGTSMSCPHISGIATLLKAVNPLWSPSAIKSALMTTSTVADNTGGLMLDAADGFTSTPLVHGAGHVVPASAMDPGLIYDMDVQNYVDYLCTLNYTPAQLQVFTKGLYHCSSPLPSLTHLNYPSFSVVYAQHLSPTFSATYRRTLRNVGAAGNTTYRLDLVSPAGVELVIEPHVLEFKEVNQRLEFRVTFNATRTSECLSSSGFKASFGSLTWKDGTHVVRTPIAFLWAA